jgi:hypothetical protein
MAMCAGIEAAIVGPEIALAGKNLLPVNYQGWFWLGAGCLIVAGLLLLFYVPVTPHTVELTSGGRSTLTLPRSPTMLLAIAAGSSAFIVMSSL